MAWTMKPNTGDIRFLISAKLGTNTVANSGHLTDADVGKPVKLSVDSTYALCADGDQIDGWLMGVNPETVDGWAFGTVQVGGRVRAQLDGASTFGAVVEAAAQAAARTADASGYGQVSTHTMIAGTRKCWRIVSGTVTDDSIVLLELQ